MELELAGKTLNAVNIDYTVGLQLSEEYFIRIESPFKLILADSVVTLSPEEDAAPKFEPLTRLVGQQLAAANIAETGTLTVGFESGLSVVVDPDPHYEAWTVTGPNGLIIVCLPGGQLSVWDAQKPEHGNSSSWG